MNEVATRNENLPMDAASSADYFSQYGEQAAMRNIVGLLLKFSKGDYMFGESNEDMAEGTELIANLETLSVGWIKWADNKPEEQIMGLVTEGFQPPKRNTLGDDDQTVWEVDETTKEPRDPWQFTNQFVMKAPGKEQLYTFSTSSRGGVNAVGELCKIYGKQSRQRPSELPVVALEVGSYDHSNKKFGRIKFPMFPVKSWASKAEFEDAQANLALNDPADKGDDTGAQASGTAGSQKPRPGKEKPATKF